MFLKKIQSLKKVKSFSIYELPRFEFPPLRDSFGGHSLSESSAPDWYTVTKGGSSSESFGYEEDEDSRVHKTIGETGDVEHHAPILYQTRSTESIKDPKLVKTPSELLRCFAESIKVTWSGMDDPSNPLNWSSRRKWAATLIVSSFTFISPVASTMVAPALPTIADEFQISSSIDQVLVMSIFLLAYAVGPFLLGPLSEIYGRVVVLQSANMFYLVFNTACGFAQTKEQMLALRFLSGLGASAPQAVRLPPLQGP